MSIINNFNQITQSVHSLELKYGRVPNSVAILAVSKRHSLNKIEQLALTTGHVQFGENIVQEAVDKITATKLKLEWHFIGNIQSNKTAPIARHFDFVHSVDRFKIAQRLSAQRPKELPPLNICIEVNLSDEPQKSGVPLLNIEDLACKLVELPQIKLRGLMAIPEKTNDFNQQRQTYSKLYLAQQNLISKGFALDTLSMGMSDDYEAAIAEGSTMIRIGTALFGER